MADFSAKRMLGGTGTLIGPPHNSQFNSVVELIVLSLPLFAESALQENIANENGLNRRLARFITNVANKNGFPFFAQNESMEDETRGNSPATDIGIHLKIEDIATDPPKITVFEGKRLTSTLGRERHQEYLIGHEKDGQQIPCGGIERFKCTIHGSGFAHAGMIGYLQEETPENWCEKINSWISDLCSHSFEPAWSEQERLTPPETDGRITKCASVVHRAESELQLIHLWINLIP
ncbi:MAG: hypothetical protein A2X80_04580 [Geobacteraceae bacterium GWB2_52_12]|nr:MAG: hypothetical protein A2X80_04580 [Geobacteraceae bacterium GWB2_52_12]